MKEIRIMGRDWKVRFGNLSFCWKAAKRLGNFRCYFLPLVNYRGKETWQLGNGDLLITMSEN